MAFCKPECLDIRQDIKSFEKRLGEITCKHHPSKRAEMVCQEKIVCTDCLADLRVHDVWKISDIPLHYSTLADQIEEHHTSAVAHTEAHYSRIKACIEDIKRRVTIFENSMEYLFSSALNSQNLIRAESEACISSQLRHIECHMSRSLTIPSNTMKACRDIGIKYGLSNATSWQILHNTLIDQSVDRSSTIAFPTVSLGQAGRLHCDIEPCPKWNGIAGAEFTFIVHMRDRHGRHLSALDSILTQIKAESKEGQSCSFKVVSTEKSYALVKVNVALPADRVVFIVTINNLYSLVTPPIKFASMPIVSASLAWTKASNSVIPISGHGAASFQNKIYVAGGTSDGKLVTVGSVFSIACLEWVDMLPIPSPRVRHGLVETNGYLWMMGGFSDDFEKNCAASMERYDLSKCVWETAPRMPVCAADFVAVAHQGHIYIIGGSASPTETLIFNADLSKWDKLPSKMK